MEKDRELAANYLKLGFFMVLTLVLTLVLIMGLFYAGFAHAVAGGSSGETLGGVAKMLSKSIGSLAGLIKGIALVAGIGFSVGSIMKFKQHKDNPTQIPVGTPVALLFIAAALIFLPNLMETAGHSLFKNPQKIQFGDGQP